MNAWSMRGGASADAGLCKSEEVFVTLGAVPSKSDIIVFQPTDSTATTRTRFQSATARSASTSGCRREEAE